MSRTLKDTKRYRQAMENMLGYGFEHRRRWGTYGWLTPGRGRFVKRRLNKARRRAWLNPQHERGLADFESNCSWKQA